MIRLAEREAALVAALQGRFPGHRVRAALGPWPASAALEPLGPGPELRVCLRRWRADGAIEWLVQVIETDLRSAAARRVRVGEPAGILAMLDGLRGIVSGFSTLEARAARMDDLAAVWEAILVEAAPEGGDPRPPMVAYRLTAAGTTTAPAAAGTTVLPGVGSVAAGARLLGKSGAVWRDLGRAADGSARLALALEEALPTGTAILRAHALPGLPEHASSVEVSADASRALATQRAIEGSLRINQLAPEHHHAIIKYRDITIAQYQRAAGLAARLARRHPMLLLPGGLVPMTLVGRGAVARAEGAERSLELRGDAYPDLDLALFLGVAP